MSKTRLVHPRPRITELLLRSKKPVTVLTAASGWGKTWAAAQAVEEWTGESVWITGQEDHTDPTRFAADLWQQLIADGHVITNKANPRTLEHLSNLLDSNQHLLIVVDEAERIHPDAMTALIRAALTHNTAFNLIIMLRRDRYPQDLYAGVPLTSVNLITSEDLAFTRQEIIELGGADSPALTRYDSHAGWPVAVTTLHQHGDTHKGLKSLIHNALEKLPQDVRDLITQLAPATVWSDALAERIVGVPPPEWQLTIVDSGLPVHRGGLGELRPHDLVRETLLKNLKTDPATYRRSLLATADHVEHRGDMRQALTHLLEAETWHQLARVLRDYTDNLAENQRWQEIIDVITPLPLAKLPPPRNAYLKHLAGIALVNVARDLRALYAAGYADQAGVDPGSRSDPSLLQAKGDTLIKHALKLDSNSQIAHVSRITLAIEHDDLLKARDLALQGWNLAPHDPTWHLHLGVLLGTIQIHVDGFSTAAATATTVRNTIRYGAHTTGGHHAARALEYHCHGLNDPQETERIRTYLKTTAADPLNEADRLYLAATSEAMLRQERTQELITDLEELRARANRPHPRSLQLIHRYRGIALLMDDHLNEGTNALKRAYQLAKHDPLVRSRTTLLHHLAQHRANNIQEAETLLQQMPIPRAPAELADQTLQRAALAHAQGNHDQALKLLTALEPQLSTFTPLGHAIHATLELTARLAAQLDPTPALGKLELLLAENPTAGQRFWWLPDKQNLNRHLSAHAASAPRTITAISRA